VAKERGGVEGGWGGGGRIRCRGVVWGGGKDKACMEERIRS